VIYSWDGKAQFLALLLSNIQSHDFFSDYPVTFIIIIIIIIIINVENNCAAA